ncbi:methyltransferase domain-containing protein [Anaerobacillus sp. HL2]|nr:methyltransferase domain-containing protein [Anaerobacillus sp. HL2]
MAQRKAKFIHGDIHHLPFADGSFDIVVSNITLEFVETKSRSCGSLRVLNRKVKCFVCGFIIKSSGQMYREKGKTIKNSVFHYASLI